MFEETKAQDGEVPGLRSLRRGALCPCTGVHTPQWEGVPPFLCTPQGTGHQARSGFSYLERPAKAQMFSVRLPSISTRHGGPPGLRGHASHAAGSKETTQVRQGEAKPCPEQPGLRLRTLPPSVLIPGPDRQASAPPPQTTLQAGSPTHTHSAVKLAHGCTGTMTHAYSGCWRMHRRHPDSQDSRADSCSWAS